MFSKGGLITRSDARVIHFGYKLTPFRKGERETFIFKLQIQQPLPETEKKMLFKLQMHFTVHFSESRLKIMSQGLSQDLETGCP